MMVLDEKSGDHKIQELILRGQFIFVSKFLEIHPTVVEIIHQKPNV